MDNDLGTNLDQLLPQGRHRPVAYGLWQSSLTEEVPEIVRKDKELQPDMIVGEVMTGEPRPIHCILAFLDTLLRCPPMVVEADDILLAPAKVGNDEPNSGKKFATMPFHLRDYPTLTIPHCGLVVELVIPDYRCSRWTPDRSRHEMLDFAVQNAIGGQTDDILEVLGFQILVDLRFGKGCIAPKEMRNIPITVSGYYWFQHRSPVLGAVHIAFAEQGIFDIAKLIETEEGVIAHAPEMPVVRSAFLPAKGLADRAIHVQHEFFHWRLLVKPINPVP